MRQSDWIVANCKFAAEQVLFDFEGAGVPKRQDLRHQDLRCQDLRLAIPQEPKTPARERFFCTLTKSDGSVVASGEWLARTAKEAENQFFFKHAGTPFKAHIWKERGRKCSCKPVDPAKAGETEASALSVIPPKAPVQFSPITGC